MKRFGSHVTVIESGPQLAGRGDLDVGAALFDLFRDEGIHVLFESQASKVSGVSGESIRAAFDQGNREQIVEGTDLLVATGRTPNTQGIGLDKAGVELDARGYIRVNEHLETTAQGV